MFDIRHVGDSGQKIQTKIMGMGQIHWTAKGILRRERGFKLGG